MWLGERRERWGERKKVTGGKLYTAAFRSECRSIKINYRRRGDIGSRQVIKIDGFI